MGSINAVPLMRDQIRELVQDSTRMRVIKEVSSTPNITVPEIAAKIGVSETTVRRHIRCAARDGTVQLCQIPDTMASRESGVNAPSFVLDAQIDVLNQLKDANESMWGLVEMLESDASKRGQMTIGETNAYIRALGEVRQQLQLQANLVEMMLRVETIKEFQVEVLNTIEEVDPVVAQKLRSRLIEKRAIRSAVVGPIFSS